MQYLKDLPPGTIYPHLLDGIKDAAEREIRAYANFREGDVIRNAETPALAAVLVEKFAEGMTKAFHIAGIDTDVAQVADVLVRNIDPDFEKHKIARWAARPADLSTTPVLAVSNDLRSTVERGLELLALCLRLQSQQDGIDRPAPFVVDKSKVNDEFARNISEASVYHSSLLKLMPMAQRLTALGRALEAKNRVAVDYGDDYAEVAIAYLEKHIGESA